MKTILFPSLIIAASLSASAQSGASVILAGFDDFISTTSGSVTSASTGIFATSSTLTGLGFRPLPGSDSLTFGGDSLFPADADNGRYSLASNTGNFTSSRSASISITIPLSYTGSFALDSLVFDAAIGNKATGLSFEILYQLNSAPVQTLAIDTATDKTFEARTYSLTETLAAGDTIVFTIAQYAGQVDQIIIDNVALFGTDPLTIPEPATASAIGVFALCGLLVRRRTKH